MGRPFFSVTVPKLPALSFHISLGVACTCGLQEAPEARNVPRCRNGNGISPADRDSVAGKGGGGNIDGRMAALNFVSSPTLARHRRACRLDRSSRCQNPPGFGDERARALVSFYPWEARTIAVELPNGNDGRPIWLPLKNFQVISFDKFGRISYALSSGGEKHIRYSKSSN